MTRFAEEFEAYVAQRAFLQRLAVDGIDPDIAFPAYRWLLDASDESIADYLRLNYGLNPVTDFDFSAAVIDALTGLGRIDL